MKQGKLYKSVGDLFATTEKDFNIEGNVMLPPNTVFMFLEEVFIKENSFSRILVKDKVLITYNPFLLKKHHLAVETKNERIQSISCKLTNQKSS